MTDREKLEAVAASFQNLLALQDQQAATQAQLIRWCVQAIEREPRQHFDLKRGVEERAEVARNRKLAMIYLNWLATKLEDDSTPYPDEIIEVHLT